MDARPGLQLDWPVLPSDAWASPSDIAAQARHRLSNAELQEGWIDYKSVLAGQEKVFNALDDLQELRHIFRNLTEEY